jgi:WD40 repeat protein
VVPRIPTIDTVRCEPPKAPVPLTIARSSDRKVGGLRFSEFTFQPLANEEQFGGQVIRRKPASSAATAANVRDAVWDDDGKSFYLLCRTGSWGTSSSILRFGHDAETSACQVALNVSVDAILYSPQGLVAVVPNRGFLLLDPVSLELTKRVSMPGMIELVVPRRGPYGLALCAADPGAETHSDGTPFSNQPMLLCGIDLSTGRVTKTYGAGHLPLPLAPDVLLPIEAARHQGVSITDDGRYALLGYHQGHWRWLTICPFRDGALRTESAQRLDLYCGTLIPVPGGSRMLAECGGATQDAALKPPEGDDKTGKSRLFLFDAAKPDAPGSWFWADRGAFLGDRFLTFDHTQTLRVFRRDGSEEVSLQLEPPATRNTNRLEHIVTCPGGRTALLSRNRVWYSLGPGSPPPAVPEETIAASLASKTNPLEPEAVETQPPPVDGTPLQVETGQSLDVQWQRLLPKPEWGSPLCQLAADGRTLYVLSTAGKLRRLDLGTLVETAVTDEGMPCVGLGLSSAGVLVAVASKDVREVRVRDPRDLRLLNTYPHTIDITAIASRPTTPITCLLTKDGHIMLMDSARGRIVQTYQKLPLPEANAKALPANMLPPPGFLLISISSRPTKPISLLAMTPDGTQLFTALGGKLVRYRLEDAKLVPLAVARQAIGDVGYVTLDQDGTYVGVISDHPVTSLDGWQPDLAQGMTKRQVALVFDAETLDAVYQAPTGGSEDHFVFDKDGSQLVTALLSRCTPQGRSLNSGCIVPFGSTTTQLLAGTDGWFLASTKSGLYRFRFVPRAVSFHEWERRQ